MRRQQGGEERVGLQDTNQGVLLREEATQGTWYEKDEVWKKRPGFGVRWTWVLIPFLMLCTCDLSQITHPSASQFLHQLK
jgi:hypothetical protein